MFVRYITILFLLACLPAGMEAQTLEDLFQSPPDKVKPIMIWQWMDGLVTADGITADLEAYKEAGIGGVQQFLVGGNHQIRVRDTVNAIGTPAWKLLMSHAISECSRLGLTFGAHNCPGWSSSAYVQVQPEYSMQKIVWSVIRVGSGSKRLYLEKPHIDSNLNYYRDIDVIAVPDRDTISFDEIKVISDLMSPDGFLNWKAPKGVWRIYRFGHTPNGKTNSSTAPMGGVGLECDKMSREALEHYWNTYPAMLLQLAGDEIGKTFQWLEIDSYEAGGQEWTKLMPEEFKKRKGYDIAPWLPVMAGLTIDGTEVTNQFINDWKETVRDLFAENYYGYMSELAHQYPGLKLLVEPYGTGASKPFNPVVTEKVVNQLANDDYVCAEFWTNPSSWGWPEVPMVVKAAHKANHQIVFAEGFTCWPLHAWKDDPNDLKIIADRAFCMGINALMLHAGAQNPWTQIKPGMTFGIWGTQWTPNQTWWQSGGAKELFTYMARCQVLLQRGVYVSDNQNDNFSLKSDCDLRWIYRKDKNDNIFFIANPTDSAIVTSVSLNLNGMIPEIWKPEDNTIEEAEAWLSVGHETKLLLPFEENEAYFVILRKATEKTGPGLSLSKPVVKQMSYIDTPWSLSFPENWGAPESIVLDTLMAWNESQIDGVKYFSGTAKYQNEFVINELVEGEQCIIDLGEVYNLARIKVNGCFVENLWRPPFQTDITRFLHQGNNRLEVEVTNLWVNRLIGDEQEIDDILWSEPLKFGNAPNASAVGRFMLEVPDWLKNKEKRPSGNRKTVVSFKFYEKDSSLLPSGLIGPVRIIKQSTLEKK